MKLNKNNKTVYYKTQRCKKPHKSKHGIKDNNNDTNTVRAKNTARANNTDTTASPIVAVHLHVGGAGGGDGGACRAGGGRWRPRTTSPPRRTAVHNKRVNVLGI